MTNSKNIAQEEQLKLKKAKELFKNFDCTNIIGKIDFSVAIPLKKWENEEDLKYLLWAEAKRELTDILAMFAQLILTIGKARTFDKIMPPHYLGAFDSEKIAFVPYHEVQHLFYQNDFNWNVIPSNTATKEFKQITETVKEYIDENSTIFNFEIDETELKEFIKDNFTKIWSDNITTSKLKIDRNNFINIYQKWVEIVKPTIDVKWESVKKKGLIDGEFFLADLISEQNKTLLDNLHVVLDATHYVADRHFDEDEIFTSKTIKFFDNQKAHKQFWNKYERPPLKEYWDFIIEHRHLLVPQDVREIKGSFFTPSICVEKSQEYLADVFGENWQDEYYIWDCAAGTGNLLAGLINKDRIFASTLDKADVDVMYQRIDFMNEQSFNGKGANLWKNQVFRFDFLNDDFKPISEGGKLPEELYNIILDENKRKKLIIYINPPYLEGDAREGKGRKGNHLSKIHSKYQKILGKASGELSNQFLIRIYKEIPDCILGLFCKLTLLQAPNYSTIRNLFLAKLEKMFIAPSEIFDNVKKGFPIGFMIFDTKKKEKFKKIKAEIFNINGVSLGKRQFNNYDGRKYISDWLNESIPKNTENKPFGHLASVGNDFQHQRDVYIDDVNRKHIAGGRHTLIYIENLIVASIFFSVRQCVNTTWLNNRDQFLYPKKKWEKDIKFHNDCLTYTLFNNNIQSKYGRNHWIPFTETELDLTKKFDSHFMTDFIGGKLKINGYADLFNPQKEEYCIKREFSTEAKAVFDAGCKLWKHYHKQPNINVNASLYDIREYFQKRNDKGKMNNSSNDEKYNELIGNFRNKLKLLAEKIEPKIYEYEFLKK